MLTGRAKRTRRPSAKVLEALAASGKGSASMGTNMSTGAGVGAGISAGISSSGIGMAWIKDEDEGEGMGESKEEVKEEAGREGASVGTAAVKLEIDAVLKAEAGAVSASDNDHKSAIENGTAHDTTDLTDGAMTGSNDTKDTNDANNDKGNDHKNDTNASTKTDTQHETTKPETDHETKHEHGHDTKSTKPKRKLKPKPESEGGPREITTLSTCPPALLAYMRTLSHWDPDAIEEWVRAANGAADAADPAHTVPGMRYELGYRGRGALKRWWFCTMKGGELCASGGGEGEGEGEGEEAKLADGSPFSPPPPKQRGRPKKAKRTYGEMETDMDVDTKPDLPSLGGALAPKQEQDVKADSNGKHRGGGGGADGANAKDETDDVDMDEPESKPPTTTNLSAADAMRISISGWTARLDTAQAQIKAFAPFDRAHAFNLCAAHAELEKRIDKLCSAVELALRVRENVTTFARPRRCSRTGGNGSVAFGSSFVSSSGAAAAVPSMLDNINTLKEFLPHHASDLAAEHAAVERELALLEADIATGGTYRETVYRRSETCESGTEGKL